MAETAISYSSRCALKTRNIRDQQDPVNRPKNDSRGLWQKLLFQPLAVRLSFFTTRALKFGKNCKDSSHASRISHEEAFLPRSIHDLPFIFLFCSRRRNYRLYF